MGAILVDDRNPEGRPAITPLQRIGVEGGDVPHALKSRDETFQGFGEAYFFLIKEGAIKPWRRHHLATLNLVVPLGKVRFVTTVNGKSFEENIVSSEYNFVRLAIPSGLWLAFQGLEQGESIILNVSNRIHLSGEIDRCDLDHFNYDW
jgi:dTDP-4-dehydrorhamnose 3,5-epimerase|tara:strand:- start:1600 stop:2043 length:444 start_codon:yes stop_codon:yes gene_type:complete